MYGRSSSFHPKEGWWWDQVVPAGLYQAANFRPRDALGQRCLYALFIVS